MDYILLNFYLIQTETDQYHLLLQSYYVSFARTIAFIDYLLRRMSIFLLAFHKYLKSRLSITLNKKRENPFKITDNINIIYTISIILFSRILFRLSNNSKGVYKMP